ncbi:MAG: flagellar assembly peptidoglycan hydrolase FlgJ [Rubrivivax sp.]|nr:flagellar assembly peptidoglycan hydrolase FlgJ [Rubrivivax sp.]MCW5634704.1 flagellar assembly peptidoglycan hydrolase FlgJ [Rubrivivax sp.]
MNAPTIASGVAFDTRSLQSLQARAASDPKAAVREAARQFEALFMQELVKSMRATTLASGMLDNAGSQMGEQMLDTQFAGALAGRPGGLSEAIMRQLERQMGLAPGPIPALTSANTTPAPLTAAAGRPAPVRIPQTAALGFVQQHGEAARSAEAASGIPAAFMVAQAAHETGWGRKEIRHADGTPSHNLFGIKAGPGWKGPVAEVTTTEYVDGQPRKLVAKFRAYGSYAESFADYARLMKTSPRYAAVLEQARVGATAGAAQAASGFAQGLQQAGYATDPAYADKLTRVINTTLRLQRSLA